MFKNIYMHTHNYVKEISGKKETTNLKEQRKNVQEVLEGRKRRGNDIIRL